MKLGKFRYYVKHTFLDVLPRFLFKQSKNNVVITEALKQRIHYYNKLTSAYAVPATSIEIKNLKKPKKLKTYYFDLIALLRYYPSNKPINFEFGDVVTVPKHPSFVKSRPIHTSNNNSVLLKLNKIRHFKFVKDKIPFVAKKDMLVGRAKIFDYHPHRIDFYQKYFHHPLCDLGAVKSPQVSQDWATPKMSINAHLKYKFILSLEGNDVATNLKWIMSSNSIAVMPMPKYETWFMEGTLIPNHHFICIKEDYSDLEENLQYYITHISEAMQIVKNANAYVAQFLNTKTEKAIAFGVIDKYFRYQKS